MEGLDAVLLPVPFGFNNIGAICWLNSLLQSLVSCTSLTKYMLENKDLFALNPLAIAYIGLLERALANPQPALMGASVDVLSGLMRANKSRIVLGNSQECANEALTMFIDLMHDSDVNALFNMVYKITIICPSCGVKTDKTRDDILTVGIPHVAACNSREAFTMYLKHHPNKLDYYTCEKCAMKSYGVVRSYSLVRTSDIIVVVLDKHRAKYNQYYPQTLVFNEKSARLAPITYTQIASIDQSGGIHGGHYIAHALRRNRVAHDFNDTMVGPGVLTPNPNTYMVFYHKDDAAAQN